MSVVFYTSGVVAVIAALLVITRVNAMHALISLIVGFLAIAGVLWSLGAPFAAVLQIVVYAGAIMVLFVFAVMVLNLGPQAEVIERGWLPGLVWVVPAILAAALLAAFAYAVIGETGAATAVVGPKTVGTSLFTTYLIGIELASVLLLAGLVAAFHYGADIYGSEADDE